MTELAARNGTERAEALLRLTGRLTELIRGETQMFQRRRPQDAVTLQDAKALCAPLPTKPNASAAPAMAMVPAPPSGHNRRAACQSR